MGRRSAEALNAAVLGLQTTTGVEAVDYDADDREIEIVVGPNYERVPPRVLRPLVEHDFGVADVSPQADGEWLLVRAR